VAAQSQRGSALVGRSVAWPQLHPVRSFVKFSAMAEITTHVCGVAFESVFKIAVLFRGFRCDEISQKCLEAFASYGLRPTQIAVRNGDQVFNYDLSFSLFNGNGTFKISSEKLEVSLQNVNSEKDWEIVQDCLAKFYEHVPLPEIEHTLITSNAHAAFASDEAMQQYLSQYANPARQIVSGGAIANILCPNWPTEIRLAAERSLAYPASLFLMWTTTHRGDKITRNVLTSVKSAFEESAAKLDLTLARTNRP